LIHLKLKIAKIKRPYGDDSPSSAFQWHHQMVWALFTTFHRVSPAANSRLVDWSLIGEWAKPISALPKRKFLVINSGSVLFTIFWGY
jgi:hypothetical protein